MFDNSDAQRAAGDHARGYDVRADQVDDQAQAAAVGERREAAVASRHVDVEFETRLALKPLKVAETTFRRDDQAGRLTPPDVTPSESRIPSDVEADPRGRIPDSGEFDLGDPVDLADSDPVLEFDGSEFDVEGFE